MLVASPQISSTNSPNSVAVNTAVHSAAVHDGVCSLYGPVNISLNLANSKVNSNLAAENEG